MEESFEDPSGAVAPADNPVEVSSAPVEPGEGAEPEVDFAERFDPSSISDEQLQEQYRLMRRDYTQKTMSLADERKALESQLAEAQQAQEMVQRLQQDPAGLLAELGLLETDDDDDAADDIEYVDNPELADLRSRIEAFEAERQYQQQTHTDVASLGADVDRINQIRGPGNELSEKELNFLGKFAERDENGTLRLYPAFEALDELFETRRQAWVKTKQAPSPPGAGGQGSEKFDITDRESRVARLAAAMDAAEA